MSVHYSILSRNRVSGKPGAVHSTIVWFLLFICAKLWTWSIQGWEIAVLSVKNWVITGLLPAVTVLALIFIYNLWLAPLRLARKKSALHATLTPDQADPVAWSKYDTVKLYEAACLWCGLEPHYPIENQNIRQTLSRLRHAIVLGNLQIVPDLEFIAEKLAERITKATSTWRPKDNQRVQLVQLRKYAGKIGDVPPFLQPLKIPEKEA